MLQYYQMSPHVVGMVVIVLVKTLWNNDEGYHSVISQNWIYKKITCLYMIIKITDLLGEISLNIKQLNCSEYIYFGILDHLQALN